ncbi:TlpA disulfide reductase family protein [Mucilaginibacter sp. UR6-11]|uniref:TlpA family protein disulfide reductase n=1 Tax=Mucilaginibacter sp. UR6-11 TaxID=1435644 RepID=UPI001E37F0F0|nr:TlpA disulfide reductase family protein [Mucilaginibacter sp. UR6-11]MCC8424289.1 TlpA family protein disulfide reductase [Mucilaginibacter sp. UR6-11]
MKTIKTLLLVIMIFCISWTASAQNKETMVSRLQAMHKETDPEKNVIAMKRIIKDFKLDGIKNAEDIDVLKGEVALSYLNVNAFQKFEAYISLVKNKFNQTSYLNIAAINLMKKTGNTDYAEKIAKKTVELYDSFKNEPSARPSGFDRDDWNRFMTMSAYPYYETYAAALHVNGKDKEALLYEEKAIKGQDLNDLLQSSVELYTALLQSQGQEDKVYDVLLKMAKFGKSSLKMNDQLKALSVKKTGSEANASLLLDSIQRNISKTYRTETEKKMMANADAHDFNLKDINGKNISLFDLKGKVVVLDFWATWCAPCIASMPAMEKITKEHPEVVFLFIATQETGTDAETRVRSYVKTHNFPENALMDFPSPTNPKIFSLAASYKITGIPAKVIIDPHGRERFLTQGYTSDTELINELEAMIAIAKEQ